jgi:Flp pilus assembly protein TadD
VEVEITSGDTKKALTLLSDWVRKNPADFGMGVQYASLLLQTGAQNDARVQFEGLLKQHPQDPIVLNNLGWLVQKDDPARALSLVTLAAKIAPRSPQVVDTLGWLKFERKDTQGAVALLKRAHDLKSDDPEIGYHFALALDATGKRAEAKDLLKSVLARNTKFEDAAAARTLVARW